MQVIATGLAATAAAGVLLLVGALWFDMPLWVAVVGFFVLMSAQGLVGPNAGALASGEVPEHPGTGSSVLGFLQWCTAGVIAPLAGLGGDADRRTRWPSSSWSWSRCPSPPSAWPPAPVLKVLVTP